MRQKGFTPIIIVILVAFIAVAGAYFAGNKNLLSKLPKISITQPSPTPMATADPTTDWKTYESPKFNYSFKYPAGWELLTFPEDSSTTKFGSNSLYNYSMSSINKYMDHGMVDWKSFMGNKPVIKIDFAVYSKQEGANQFVDKNSFLENLLINKATKKLESSDLKIGNLSTTQFKATEDLGPTDVPEINTFVAYPDDDRIIYFNLFFWNVKSYDLLKETPEWKEFSLIISTFKFTQ